MLRELIAKVLGESEIFHKRAVGVRRGGGKANRRTQVVVAIFAAWAAAAGDLRFQGYTVAFLEGSDGGADRGDGAGGFVAHDQGLGLFD